jgi:hypothetical protein
VSFPASLQLATLTGTYLNQEGNPEAGTVTIPYPSRMVYDPGTSDRCVIIGSPVVKSLVAGAFSQVLIRTDNTGLTPFEYTLTENILGEPAKQLTFELTGDLDVSEVPG